MHSAKAENRMRYRAHGSISSMKSRNHLTEAEREERRIRRVLANRESARQTIRRRQAMYEQLTRNAAVLATENENLKTKKEQALTKFSSLKSLNECLKDLLDKASKAEAIRIQCGDTGLCHKPSTSSSAPALLCGQPSVVPFFWPPFFNPSDACQPECTCQKCIAIASLVSHAELEQGMHKSIGIEAPVYVMPLPWFFPLQMHYIVQSSQPSIQYLQRGDTQSEVYMDMPCSAGSSSQADGHMEKCHASNAYRVNSEIPYLTMSTCQDGGISVAPEEDSLVEMEAASPYPSPTRWGLATKSEKPIPCSSKSSDSGAAASEARKRRKELTKLKTLYCRNHRGH